MKSVNEALNGIYIEEEDFEKLATSVTTYTNFDQVLSSLLGAGRQPAAARAPRDAPRRRYKPRSALVQTRGTDMRGSGTVFARSKYRVCGARGTVCGVLTERVVLAGMLYNKNKRYQQALELAKKDKLYKDAMQTAQ
eukprot:714636-Rhodomonas_salina.1